MRRQRFLPFPPVTVLSLGKTGGWSLWRVNGSVKIPPVRVLIHERAAHTLFLHPEIMREIIIIIGSANFNRKEAARQDERISGKAGETDLP